MNWKCFDLTFSIKSAIHIGYRKIGLLQRTRYYVPGKNLWAALTARMTPILRNSPSESDYREVSDILRQNTIFSYFYLRDSKREFFPEFKRGIGLSYGDLSQDEFEWRFITSVPTTAIDHEIGSTEYGSLHEVEVITGNDRKNEKQMYLGGHLFVREQENLNSREDDVFLEDESIVQILKEGIFVGGERSYGFGKVCLEKFQETKDSEYQLKDTVLLRINEGTPIRSHLRVAEGIYMKGEIEAFSGREWCNKGSGRKKSQPLIAWVPGSVVMSNYLLEVGEFGVL